MKILFQGDSITHGGRVESDWDFNHTLGHGYVFNITGEIIAKNTENDYVFINKGINGNRVVDLYARWKEDTISLKPDLLSILIGSNDLTSEKNFRSTSNKVFERTYDLLIKDIKDELPNTKIVLCEPFRLDLNTDKYKLEVETKEDLLEKQKISYAMSQKYNTAYVPLQSIFNKVALLKPAINWMWDGVHPTAAGHYLIARQWISIVSDKKWL